MKVRSPNLQVWRVSPPIKSRFSRGWKVDNTLMHVDEAMLLSLHTPMRNGLNDISVYT